MLVLAETASCGHVCDWFLLLPQTPQRRMLFCSGLCSCVRGQLPTSAPCTLKVDFELKTVMILLILPFPLPNTHLHPKDHNGNKLLGFNSSALRAVHSVNLSQAWPIGCPSLFCKTSQPPLFGGCSGEVWLKKKKVTCVCMCDLMNLVNCTCITD